MLTRDGTAESVSRNQIHRRERGQGKGYFPCSAGHEQDWQPYPRLIHTLLSCVIIVNIYLSVPASPDQGHDRLCRRGVGRVFLAGVRPDSPSRRRIPSCYRPGPGRGVVVELGQRGAH